MNRSNRFLGGVTVGYVNMAAVMIAGLWLTPFFLGRLGQHDYGLWLVGLQILAYLALMDFGVVALLGRATAYATGRAGGIDKAADLPDVIGQTVRLVLWQVPLVVLVACAVWRFMPAAWSPLQGPLGLVLIVFVVMFPIRALGAVLQGLQDLAFVGKVQLGTWLTGTVVTVAAVVAGRGLPSLALGWVVAQTLAGAFWAYRLRRRFPGTFPARLPALSASPATRPRLLGHRPAGRTRLACGYRRFHHRHACRPGGSRAVCLHRQVDQRAGQSTTATDAGGGACAQRDENGRV